MIKKNDISVVIPMYNAQNTIVKVLDSINLQSGAEYIKEIIVVNDGSKDASSGLVKNYNSKIPIRFIDKENGGVSAARNSGMKQALGNWIAFCDSDDVWLKDKILLQVKVINKLQNKTGIDFIGGNHYDADLKILFRKIIKIHRMNVKEMCIKMYPQPSTVIMNRSIFDSLGGFDETQKYAEDGNYFLKIAAKYKCYYIPKQLVIYDGGKRGFGSSGLSANLKGMHKGNLKNIYELWQSKTISTSFYCLMNMFYRIKYFRRLLLVAAYKIGK